MPRWIWRACNVAIAVLLVRHVWFIFCVTHALPPLAPPQQRASQRPYADTNADTEALLETTRDNIAPGNWSPLVAIDASALDMEALVAWGLADGYPRGGLRDRARQQRALARLYTYAGAWRSAGVSTPDGRNMHRLRRHIAWRSFDNVLNRRLPGGRSAGVGRRNAGLEMYMRAVCAAEAMACPKYAPEPARPLPPPAERGIPPLVHAPRRVLRALKLPTGFAAAPPLRDARLETCLNALRLRGGVCVLSALDRLPPDLLNVVRGASRFAVARGTGISDTVCGSAAGATAWRSTRHLMNARRNLSWHALVLPATDPPAQRIPRIFHFIHLGGADLSSTALRCIRAWQKHHPGWRTMIWTDERIRQLRLANFAAAARTLAQRSDVVRFEVLHRFGGVYADTDFDCFRNIEHLLAGQRLVLCNEANSNDFMSSGFIAATPRHEVLRRAVVRVQDATLNRKWINQDTGPFFLRSMLGASPDARVLPTNLLFPVPYQDRAQLMINSCYESSCARLFPRAFACHLWSQQALWLRAPKLSLALQAAPTQRKRLEYLLHGR